VSEITYTPLLKRLILLMAMISIIAFQPKAYAQDLEKIGEEKAVTFSGSLNVGAWVYGSQGIEKRRSPFSWYISGSPTLTIYNLTLPFSFTISEQQRYFSQPFNRFGVSPYYKWVTLHGGYRSMYFSDYTLAGEVFLGGGVELNPGKFRFAAMYGRFRKAVEEVTDTSLNIPNLPASYKRMGYGMKVGFGSKSSFVDFIIFKAADDSSSLPQRPVNTPVRPMDNLVLGVRSNILIANRVTFNFDVSASALTLDTKTVESFEIPQELSPYQNLLTINQSTIFNTAGHASLHYNGDNFGLMFKVKRIDPGYQSLGIYYIQSDLIDYTVSPDLRLFKGKLYLKSSFGIRKDNLNNKKPAETRRTIGSAALNFNPTSKFGMSVNYANYGTSQASGLIQLNDSIRMSVVNTTYGGNIRFTNVNERIVSSFIIMTNYNEFNDQNQYTQDFTESSSVVGNASYNFSIVKTGTSFNVSYNVTNFKNNFSNVFSHGPVAGVSMQFLEKKLTAAVNLNYQKRRSDEVDDGGIFQGSLRFSYRIKDKHTFNLESFYTRNNSGNISSFTYNEQRISLRYGYTF